MRILGAAIVASLVVTNAFAATTLPAGKPAGVKKAEYQGDPTLFIVLGVAIAIGIAVAVSSGNDDHNGGTTTPTTGTA